MTNHPLTDQQLNDIETRANAATDGPWTVELEQCDCSDGYCHHGTYVSAIYAADGARRDELGDFTDADWQFTIHARTDVPALVAEVRRLRAELAAVTALHEKGEHNGLPICLHCASQMFPPPESGIWSESAYPCATLRALGVTDEPAAAPVP